MTSIPDIDERRRRFLLYLLGSGALIAVPGCSSQPKMHQAMDMPDEMPEDKSIFQYMGSVDVNGQAASLATKIEPGDIVETGEKSQMVFVVGKDSFLMRANSRMIVPTKREGGVYELQKGAALGVFASRQTEIRTPSAIVSIRGTGVYFEVEPELSYVCTCYGVANLATSDNPSINETVESKHHDDPKYILADQNAANRIQSAPFKNHDDQELLLIETLVGRTTPYVVPQGLKRTRGSYL